MCTPERKPPADTWEHFSVWQGVKAALRALPAYFKTSTHIEGILATDIFTLNTVLGATIEEQVVTTLNAMRPVWDLHDNYQAFYFVRQAQTFPDVLLQRQDNGREIIMGIELKGWYLLAKEGMGSYRFRTSADACANADLIVVVPWVLSNVLAGSPVALEPWVELAKYAAECRNYYWQHERDTQGDTGITPAWDVKPYPEAKAEQIADKADDDAGGNFGRIARYHIMDAYQKRMLRTTVRGVTAQEWLKFFRQFK